MTINSNQGHEGFSWRPMLVLSLLFHGALFSMLFWVPGNSSGSLRMNEAVYEVYLKDSSLSKDRVSPSSTQKSVAAPEKREAKRISSSSQKNTVTVAKKTSERIKSKPEKTQASSNQLLDKAISSIEKKVNTEKNTDYLDKTIADLDRKMGSSGSGAPAGSLAINMYKMEVETLIKDNWTYPGEQDIEAVVLVKIRKDGTILGTSFIKPSGDKIFDESVLTAIEKTKSLPPLPEGYEKNYEEIKINFNLRDLE